MTINLGLALEVGSKGNFLVLNEAVPALKELGDALGAYFMRWDARNFGYDTHEKYAPSEKAYYEEHGQNIVNLMREDRSLNAKTIIRNRYNSEWICENQLMPLLEDSFKRGHRSVLNLWLISRNQIGSALS